MWSIVFRLSYDLSVFWLKLKSHIFVSYLKDSEKLFALCSEVSHPWSSRSHWHLALETQNIDQNTHGNWGVPPIRALWSVLAAFHWMVIGCYRNKSTVCNLALHESCVSFISQTFDTHPWSHQSFSAALKAQYLSLVSQWLNDCHFRIWRQRCLLTLQAMTMTTDMIFVKSFTQVFVLTFRNLPNENA